MGIQICFDQQNGCLNIYGAFSWIFWAMPFVNPSFSKKSALPFPPSTNAGIMDSIIYCIFWANHFNTCGLPPSLFPEKEKKNPTCRMLHWVTYMFEDMDIVSDDG
jgi:hypothetical protein